MSVFEAAPVPAVPACCDDQTLSRLLHEDVPFGDLTTQALGLGGRPGVLGFSARGPMTVSGLPEAARLFALVGAQAQVLRRAGATAAGGERLLSCTGPATALLKAWKTAQTLAEAMSGIATAARQIIDSLREAGVEIPLACTRKNFPGTRVFAAQAVRDGGATMHRLGLSETLLVFPEHRAFLTPGDQHVAIAQLRRAHPERRVVVEVGDADSALALAAQGVDVLQLERFSPEALSRLRARLTQHGLHPMLAPAGGVTARNAVDYARAGADFLVSSAPYFAAPADIRVEIAPAPD